MVASSGRRLFEGAALLFILLLAAYLRLSYPGIVEYKRDEANLSRLALDVAHGRAFHLLGIGSSVGFPNAPMNVYLLAVPYWFDDSPILATQFIGLLNVGAVLALYIVARHYYGIIPALLAALLFAANPWAVIFSRKIWAQNMLPVFVVLVFWTAVAGFIKDRRWGQVLHLPLLVTAGQVHYAAFVLIPGTLIALIMGRKRLTRPFFVGGVCAIVLTVPFIVGLSRANLLNITRISESITRSESEQDDSGLLAPSALRGARLITAGNQIHALAGPDEFENYLQTVPDVYWFFDVLPWVAAASAVWLVVRLCRRRDARTPVDFLLLTGLIFPVLAYSIRWTDFHIHYLIPMLPFACLVIGVGVGDVYSRLGGRRRMAFAAVMGALLAAVVVFQMWLWLALLSFVDGRATPDGFGPPLHYLMRARAAIIADGNAVIADLGGDAIGIDGEPTIWAALLYNSVDVRFERSNVRVYPQDEAGYLTFGCLSTDGGRVFPLREGEGCYHLARRGPDDLDPQGLVFLENPAQFANGAAIIAYRYSPLCLSILWSTTARAVENYFFAVHFYDASNNRISIADGLSWAGHYWRPGDRLVSTFCAAEVGGVIASVRLGMYTYDGQNYRGVPLLQPQTEYGMVAIPLDQAR